MTTVKKVETCPLCSGEINSEGKCHVACPANANPSERAKHLKFLRGE